MSTHLKAALAPLQHVRKVLKGVVRGLGVSAVCVCSLASTSVSAQMKIQQAPTTNAPNPKAPGAGVFNEAAWRTQWTNLKMDSDMKLHGLMIYHNPKYTDIRVLQTLAAGHREQMGLLNQLLVGNASAKLLYEGYMHLFQMHEQWARYVDMEGTPQLMQTAPYREFFSMWSQMERTWLVKMQSIPGKKAQRPKEAGYFDFVLYQGELARAGVALWWQSAHAVSALDWMWMGQTAELKNVNYAFSIDQCRHLGAYWGLPVDQYLKRRQEDWEKKRIDGPSMKFAGNDAKMRELSVHVYKDYMNHEAQMMQYLGSNTSLNSPACQKASEQGVLMRGAFASKFWN